MATESVSTKYNMRSPAVKRICQEIKEMQRENDSADFMAEALESDIFEWHFVVRGPPGTEFEGGIYHGRVLLPPEYPFKPPSFMMLTPNGRFQPGVKICLSISSHHPEHWQPSWSVRTALTALIAFMPSPGHGALGSLDFSKEERMQLAQRSRVDIPKFGSPARQKVIDDMHKAMLQRIQQQEQQQGQQAQEQGLQQEQQQQQEQQEQQQQQQASEDGNMHSSEAANAASSLPAVQPVPAAAQGIGIRPLQDAATAAATTGSSAATSAPASTAAGASEEHQPSAQLRHRAAAATREAAAPGSVQMQQPHRQIRPPHTQAGQQQHGADTASDRGLTLLAIVLVLAIVALLLKKVAYAFGGLGEIASGVSNL